MTDQSVHDVLQDLADEAPTFRAIPTATVVKRISHSRTRGAAVAGAGSLLLATSAIIGTILGVRWLDSEPTNPAHEPQKSFRVGNCGQPIKVLDAVDAPIRLTLDFPREVSLADGGVLKGKATFTNVSNRRLELIRGLYEHPILARQGRTATDELPVKAVGIDLKLAPGASVTADAWVSLQRCDVRREEVPWPQREADLMPGEYELYAVSRLPLQSPPGPEPEIFEVFSGPFTITLR